MEIVILWILEHFLQLEASTNSTLEVSNAFEHITDNLASYNGLCGHQPPSQGSFRNAEWLIGFLLQLIALR